MESMSTHILSFDNKDTRDLLGALRKNIKEDMFFTNFVSEGDGTSDSLTRLFVAVPDLNLSTSAYSGKSYICNIVELFKRLDMRPSLSPLQLHHGEIMTIS